MLESQTPSLPRQFRTTRWSLVLQARGEGAEAKRALEDLCQSYWFPLYAWSRRYGLSAADAEDMVQDCFQKIIEKCLFHSADPARGKLRTFLLTVLHRHIQDEHGKSRTARRGGGKVVSFDSAQAEEWYSMEDSKDESLNHFSSPWRNLDGLKPDQLMDHGIEELSTAKAIAGFEIKKMISRGGMGAVYLARQIELNRDVAIKLVVADKSFDPTFLERLECEARIMAKLKNPHIVTVYHFERLEEGQAAIVMEYVEGGNLRDQIEKHPQGIPLKNILKWTSQVISALAAAHASKIVHRDIKPENILINQEHSAQITDFGIALPLPLEQTKITQLTFTSTTVGTLDYFAPEQFQFVQPDVRSDIYSMGVVLYEMLTGQVPRGNFKSPRKLRPDVPVYLNQAIMRALCADPNDRFSSMEDFLLAIESPSLRFTRRHWLVAGTMGCGIAIAAPWLMKSFSSPGEDVAKESPATGEWKNALSEVMLPQSVISGYWKWGEYLETDGNSICILALEREMPESYDAKMTFFLTGTRHTSVAFFFASNGSVGSVDIGYFGEGMCGVHSLDGYDLTGLKNFKLWLEGKRHYELKIEVRPQHVKVFIDDEQKGRFMIENRTLGIPPQWRWDPKRKPAALAIGTYHNNPVSFKSVEWRVVE